MAFLEVKDIKKTFGTTEVLKGITFSMEKGDVLAIIGSSGSGKSTMLRCLNFLERPTKGSISVNSQVVFDDSVVLKEKEIQQKRVHFGLVFQSFNLFPQYTAFENITLAPKLALKNNIDIGIAKTIEDVENNADLLLETVGLSDKRDFYPCQLSGGQQQRVAIARALAMKPDILCFDEPTSALDPELTGEVLRVIRGLKSSDRTMIVVTHEMEFAKNVADKVIFMANGVIEEMGSSKDVFENPKSELLKSFLNKAKDK